MKDCEHCIHSDLIGRNERFCEVHNILVWGGKEPCKQFKPYDNEDKDE